MHGYTWATACICHGGPLLSSNLWCILRALWQKLARKQTTTDEESLDLPSEESVPQSSSSVRSNPLRQVAPGVFTETLEIPDGVAVTTVDAQLVWNEDGSQWTQHNHTKATAVVDNTSGKSMITHQYQGELTIPDTGNAWTIYDSDNQPVVSVDLDTADVALRDKVGISEAAIAFWNAVEKIGHSRLTGYTEIIDGLTRSINDRNDAISRLTAEIEDLKMIGTTSPEDQDNRFKAVGEEL